MDKMNYNFEKLNERVIDSLSETDLNETRYKLRTIDKPTIITGVGGSSVVSNFASKVLAYKNGIITNSFEPRDMIYLNIKPYSNILACSYSGNNHGVKTSFDNDLKHFLLSSGKIENAVNITYKANDKENSFISLAATLIPCTILLDYYINGEDRYIIDNLDEYKYSFDVNCDAYEIFSGFDTSTASKFLESTMVESGIGIPIVHDKYSYCHGRSTISINNNNIAIFFDTNTELDKLLLEEIKKYYKDVVVITTGHGIFNDYLALLKSMYLAKYIAEEKQKDLSKVEYSPVVKKLYKYNGKM